MQAGAVREKSAVTSPRSVTADYEIASPGAFAPISEVLKIAASHSESGDLRQINLFTGGRWVLYGAAFYLIINIHPGHEGLDAARHYDLKIDTPQVTDIFFGLAFGTRPLGVMNELDRQIFVYDIAGPGPQPYLFDVFVVQVLQEYFVMFPLVCLKNSI